MTLPACIELLDSKKYFELYYDSQFTLTPMNNYMFNLDREKFLLDKKIANYLQLTGSKALKKANWVYIMIMTGQPKKTLDRIFGNGKGTTRLGEGKATVYFMKVLGKTVMLFHDNRGTSTELEVDLTKEDYVNIAFEIFKYIYENVDEENKQFFHEIHKRVFNK